MNSGGRFQISIADLSDARIIQKIGKTDVTPKATKTAAERYQPILLGVFLVKMCSREFPTPDEVEREHVGDNQQEDSDGSRLPQVEGTVPEQEREIGDYLQGLARPSARI